MGKRLEEIRNKCYEKCLAECIADGMPKTVAEKYAWKYADGYITALIVRESPLLRSPGGRAQSLWVG